MLHVTTHDVRIPALGLGTFGLNGAVCERIVSHALAHGYRHVDTAQMYGNEAEVGAGIRRSAVPRDEIWLTTKIWPDRFRDGDLQRAAEESVRRLRTEPDLLLLHWPNPVVPRRETIAVPGRVPRNPGAVRFVSRAASAKRRDERLRGHPGAPRDRSLHARGPGPRSGTRQFRHGPERGPGTAIASSEGSVRRSRPRLDAASTVGTSGALSPSAASIRRSA